MTGLIIIGLLAIALVISVGIDYRDYKKQKKEINNHD